MLMLPPLTLSVLRRAALFSPFIYFADADASLSILSRFSPAATPPLPLLSPPMPPRRLR